MPSFTSDKFSNFYKRILQIGNSDNSGTPTSTTSIQAGDGTSTCASISDDVLQVKPQTDNTTGTFDVQNSSGNSILKVDTTNSKILGGAGQVALNTQYAHFGISAYGAYWDDALADTHYAIPFMSAFSGITAGGAVADYAMGSSTSSSFNDANPATSLTISTTSASILNCYWYVMDDITIDSVKWWHGADSATGDSTAGHLMAYTVDSANGSTSGDLSSGVVVADGGTITNAGYEQLYYQAMTVQSANVDAGKVMLFTFASDTVNSDYTINATIKFHLR
jgi:hypothetical protein